MYTLSSKLKLTAIIFIVVGAIGMIYGFLSAPSSIEEVEQIIAEQGAHHGESHGETAQMEEHQPAGHHSQPQEMHGADADHSSVAEGHESSHAEHLLHQLQNKPWAATYVAAFFFFMIALGALAFYAVQYAAQAGWSPVLYRVIEAVTAYLLPGSLIMLLLLALSGMHFNHLFVWMDPEVVKHDELIQGKSAFLNVPFFLIRAVIYIAGWNIFRYLLRKNSLRHDEADHNRWFKQSFKLSAGFLVFFIVTESMMSWDWIMSVDPHWYSTLFGWYVFASLFVSAITVIALITIYLKSRGYLEYVNNSHIHDLAKFMFGISIFWTYLWFSQFMLIWYSNIPEEVTYFITRIEDYNLPFFGMIVLNFLFPLLVLMNSDYKRVNWFVVMAGVVILIGHYIDIYNMIMPATVGKSWFIGIPEISAIFFFGGLFVFVVFNALTKAPLLAKRNPYIEESKHYHY
ncbi:quinol:cytochrome c oxidoreductase quinone-binding subunit 2 [Mesonia phycicola]|uniref:Quinol:cytochrome c oxidoreductase quinone-binding subunit 2 n=1 Tax=Mesonia phycicola TaxID=579105 RepID=A0A1M6EUE1_9FLAO|nr:quinol:cytochrome C oxidoreductase [Mesonia phycicola]SHI89057.1 quinol:cytochrome c oxidoreductase quinone-binding subunit 2 [Mesonia phycicola]